jgi:hypothetical protein
MFYPLQTATDNKLDGSYWKLSHREQQLSKKRQDTIIRKKGFEILLKTETSCKVITQKMKEIVTRNTINKLDTIFKSSKNKETLVDIKDITDMDG